MQRTLYQQLAAIDQAKFLIGHLRFTGLTVRLMADREGEWIGIGSGCRGLVLGDEVLCQVRVMRADIITVLRAERGNTWRRKRRRR